MSFSETVRVGAAQLVLANVAALLDASCSEFAFMVFSTPTVIMTFVLSFGGASADEVVGIPTETWATHACRSVVLRFA